MGYAQNYAYLNCDLSKAIKLSTKLKLRHRHFISLWHMHNKIFMKTLTRKSITCYYMLYKGVATCYLNLLVISSCCFDTNSEFTEMFLMIHLYQIAQLKTKLMVIIYLNNSLNLWPN